MKTEPVLHLALAPGQCLQYYGPPDSDFSCGFVTRGMRRYIVTVEAVVPEYVPPTADEMRRSHLTNVAVAKGYAPNQISLEAFIEFYWDKLHV